MASRFIVCVLYLLFASTSPACAGAGQWIEIDSLFKLPVEVQHLLGAGPAAKTIRISDRNGPFNSTDVVVDNTPMERFVMAYTDDNTALVLIEHGGRGYYRDVFEFKKIDGTWKAQRPMPQDEWPAKLKELASHWTE